MIEEDLVAAWIDGSTLDHSSPVPLYHQVATHIEAAIQSGALAPGDKLENELALAGIVGVSRPTMRAALKEVVDKGLLVRRRGVGTVVTGHGPVRRKLALSSLYDDLKASGHHPSTRLLSDRTINCPDEAAGPLHLRYADQVRELHRVRLADGEPMAWLHNILPAGLAAFTDEALAAGSLYGLMRANGVRPSITHQTLSAEAADQRAAELLDVAIGAPLLVATRHTYDSAGRAIEYAVHRYRADSYSFEVTLMGGG